MQPKQALNSGSSCLALPSTEKNHFLKLLLGYSRGRFCLPHMSFLCCTMGELETEPPALLWPTQRQDHGQVQECMDLCPP